MYEFCMRGKYNIYIVYLYVFYCMYVYLLYCMYVYNMYFVYLYIYKTKYISWKIFQVYK